MTSNDFPVARLVRRPGLLGFLWLSVFAWALALGGKLFELTVLVPAWAANPPQSFALLPYGDRWPNNPGDFFQPVSALLLLSAAGSLIAGWKTTPGFRVLLWLPMAALLVVWAVTPTIFWPLIQDLIWTRNGTHGLRPEAAPALAMKWIVLDWLRTVFIAVGFIASVRAISTWMLATPLQTAAVLRPRTEDPAHR